MKVGVMGGTFDPIHIGHLLAAQEVRAVLGLDRVLFVPAGAPPHKEGDDISSVGHRARMVELAIASNPCFELSLVDVERQGVSYTVDTLRILRQRLGAGTELYFIAGMDSLSDLLTWRDPHRLISLSRLAIVNRPPYPPADLATLEARLPGVTARIDMVNMPGVQVSSTDLRARVASGLPIKYLVPDPVESYIQETGIYG